jgi:hypothetical protein
MRCAELSPRRAGDRLPDGNACPCDHRTDHQGVAARGVGPARAGHQLPPNPPRGEVEQLFGDPLVVPGTYTVTLSQRVGGVVSQLAGPVTFNVVLDTQGVHTIADQDARWQFQEKLQALRRDIAGSLELTNSINTRLEAIRKALDATPAAPRQLHDQARADAGGDL